MDMYELGKEIQHSENDQLTVEGKENSDCAFVKGKRSTVGAFKGVRVYSRRFEGQP